MGKSFPPPLLIGIPALLLGLLQLAETVIARRRGAASKSWPTTTGRVLSSNVRETRHHTSYVYIPEVRYEFADSKGVNRDGKVIRWGVAEYGLEEDARKVVERYPVGSAVQVLYNPNDPRQSALEPGVTGQARLYIGAVAGLVLVAIGVAVLVAELVEHVA